MSNIFDITRFGNYFLYDLRRAKNNYGINLLIMGLTPVILLIFYLFISLIRGKGISAMPDGLKFGGIVAIVMVVILSSGARTYGFITDKRSGSDFLMLPASTFEKWLSMVIMVCIVLPVVLFVLLAASDTLLSAILPAVYGSGCLKKDSLDLITGPEIEGISFNLPAVLFLSWCQSLLVFTLGAICFKKAKVAKTILCIMGFSMLVSTLMVLIVGTGNIDLEIHQVKYSTIITLANWIISIIYALTIGGLLWGLWFRLRTIKH